MYADCNSPITNYDIPGNVSTHKIAKQSYLFDFYSSFNFLTTSDFLVTPVRDSIFSTWQIIETQLAQVDPVKELGIYKALDERANSLFSARLRFRYVGVEA